jgi:FMN phosphatase YigB (HAD superfamily)
LNVEPSVCANVGNRFHKDITGCKRAGFALGILIENPDQPQPDQSDKSSSPDMAIHSLVQLLDIFPRRMDTSKLQ